MSIIPEIDEKIRLAGSLGRKRFGKKIAFYVPGMMRWNNVTGKYQAVSITGKHCALQCDHCAGSLLDTMAWTTTADDLLALCIRLKEKGNHGVLISGGCNEYGKLPWDKFLPTVWKIKEKTGLYISVHSGLVDRKTAFDMKAAGIDQVLIDVIGDDETYQRVCHVSFGVSRITDTLEAMAQAELDIVPHVVCGLHFGLIRGEANAIRTISQFPVRQVVIVSLMKIPGTPSMSFSQPTAKEVANIIAEARLALPEAVVSLGCARERGNREMEILAINAGIQRMALPSDEAVAHCRKMEFEMKFQPTCCSVARDF